MSGGAPSRVLIVGGGSAGWITASYLNAVLNNGGFPPVAVTVVESPSVGRIGVGEATVPSIRHTLSRIGLEETTFMKAADATFKNAICFENWTAAGGAYFHPFDRRAAEPSDGVARTWLGSDRSLPWADMVSTLAALSVEGYAPKALGWPSFGSTFPYAYHMDAEKFADYLAGFSGQRGVAHLRDDVVDVEREEDGDIKAVRLASGGAIEADLFIDCTGFAGVLIGKVLGVDWVDFSHWLLCDRAVSFRIPYETHYPDRIKPYTTATALSAGWAWDIGLLNRRGRGYVYSSAHIDDDAAEAELRALEGAHCDAFDARRLKFRVGRRRAFWAKNVIAIGLSSGFIEPLESTALYTVEFAASALCDLFPRDGADVNVLRNRYNQLNASLFDEVLDFINLHYCLSDRRDTSFWRDAGDSSRMTETINGRLSLWREKPPSHFDFGKTLQLFSPQSYEYILYGMGFGAARAPEGGKPALAVPAELAKITAAARQKFPKHQDWLRNKLSV